MKTRREFLVNCSASAAGLVLAGAGFCGMPRLSTSGFTSLAQISYRLLAGQVNTPFRLRLPSGRSVSLLLIEAPLAPELSNTAKSAELLGSETNESFSLIFSGAQENLVEAGIHCLEHGQLGLFEMYLGRIDRPRCGRVLYEAVFNRPAPGAPSATAVV